jgi:hypothetical protein
MTGDGVSFVSFRSSEPQCLQALDGDGVSFVSYLSRHLMRGVAVLAMLITGCGGKPAPVTPAGGSTVAARDDSASMIPPETMDEIQRTLDRKRATMSRCLALAVDAKELPRNAKGKVTLDLVIAPGGKATEVKIVRASIESKSLDECLISRVREIQFPDVSKPVPTSYTYGFEAM